MLLRGVERVAEQGDAVFEDVSADACRDAEIRDVELHGQTIAAMDGCVCPRRDRQVRRMHVVLHVTKFADWTPVPADVKVSQDDIMSGKVKPGRVPGSWEARVIKTPPGGTTHTVALSEGLTIQKQIHEKTDVKRAGRHFTRKEAVAHTIQDHFLEGFDWSWITKIEVHDDGPDEALCRAMLKPHADADHGRRVGKNIPPEHLEDSGRQIPRTRCRPRRPPACAFRSQAMITLDEFVAQAEQEPISPAALLVLEGDLSGA